MFFSILRRKSSTTTPPQSPRMLPPTPTTAHSRSSTCLNSMGGPSSGRRPRSGPGGLSSYAGISAPQSRSGSRYDLSAPGSSLPPSRAGSRPDLNAVGGCVGGPSRVPLSAPSSPQMSPQHFPRSSPPPLHELESWNSSSFKGYQSNKICNLFLTIRSFRFSLFTAVFKYNLT